jgi:dTDP-4-amino-4,6-dideoxygalactose transaminase
MKIKFLDLKRQYSTIKKEVDAAIQRVVNCQFFVLGAELKIFETNFAKFLKIKHVCGVNSGTDGLIFALKALGVGPGDEVITPTLSFIATTLAITEVGARPVFVDSDPDTFLIDTNQIEEKITKKTKVILPVHLYGAPCEIEKIVKIAKKYKIKVVEDACQAVGARLKQKRIGTFGDIGVFSFYPGKNLGAYGDGGAIVTNNSKLYKKFLSLRNYGQKVKYYHDEIGVNSRLDEIQAAVLNIKLKYLDGWNRKRNIIMLKYKKDVSSYKFQKIVKGGTSCYHICTIQSTRRRKLMAYLEKNGVQTLVHYPVPIHLQKCYKYLGFKRGAFLNAEKISAQVVSLPLFSEMKDSEISYIVGLLNSF